MIVFISTLGLHEYYKLAERKGASPQIALGLIFGFLVSCVFIWERMNDHIILPLSVTLGLKPIRASKRLILIALGAGKAEMVARLRAGDTSLPVTLAMQGHPNAVLLLDRAAAGMR